MKNLAKEKFLNGGLSLGVGIRQSRTVDIGKIMAASDYDWLFIDMEHNSMDVDTASQISVAAQDAGICPIVRVPDFAHHHATRVLDCGAMGIVFPHVDDADTARKLVSYCLYPPKGHRSMTGSLPQLNFEKLPIPEVAKIINESMLVVIMLESPTAIDNVEEIASIPGVDVILIGTNDLCMEMGIPGDYSNPKIKEAYKKVIAACNKYNKTPGMGGVYNEELMSEYITMGMRFILSGSDLSFMMTAAQQRSKNLRSFLKK
jgi:4-hydroxy-2-oxoheptanedioate aldolase|tara:strand:- start:1951 stop:2730 length:780 start_codon:yes stop_codon:yes gene_type:complete